MNLPDIRIGNGYDVHRLVEGRKLILGGVDVPHSMGLDGHSDTDPKWKGVSSLRLLKEVMGMCKGFKLANVDSVIVAQQPKLAPHLAEMKKNIASALDVEIDRVNIKATTTEKLGFVGREEGIAAYAVALLVKK